MKFPTLIFACWLALVASSPAAAPGVVIEGRCAVPARGGDGTVWGSFGMKENRIATLDGERWVWHEIPELHEGCVQRTLATVPDGDVVGLWEDRSAADDGWVVTRHRAGESRVWKKFRATLREPTLLGRGDGSVIITESGPALVLIPAAEKPALVTKIVESMFVRAEKPDYRTELEPFAPVRAVEDATGALWFWSEQRQPEPFRTRLAGVVRCDFARRTQRLCQLGNDKSPITQVVVWDETHLGLALAGRGLALATLDFSTVEMQPMPYPGAFSFIEQLFHDGTAWHVVTTPQPDAITEGGPNQLAATWSWITILHYPRGYPVSALWRFADGAWTRLLEGLEIDPHFGPRPWVRAAAGLFVGSAQTPPWFIPDAPAERPRRITNARLFPLRAVRHMVLTSDDRILMVHPHEDACLWPVAAIEPPDEHRRWEALSTCNQAVQDARGRIWCVRRDGRVVRWENGKWTPHPGPDETSLGVGFSADDRDRGWILPVAEGETSICDFSDGSWQVFPSFTQALEAQLPRGVKLTIPFWPIYEPAFSGDGRIGVFIGREVALLFEGGKWRRWRLDEIFAGKEELTSGPFFSTDGHFSIPIGDATARQWRGAEGWQRIENIAIPTRRHYETNHQYGLDARLIWSSTTDRFGVEWRHRRGGGVTKTGWGRSVPVFSAGETDPFQYARGIYAALADDRGHTLVSITEIGNEHEHVFIHPRVPPPRAVVRVLAVGPATALLAFRAEPPDGAWFTWRIDGGPWQTSDDGADLRLENLAPGEHRVEVHAWNAELTPGAPATATLRVR